MVMRSFRLVELTIPVKKEKIQSYKKKLKEEFGDKLKIKAKENEISVSGESLSNYKVHDKVIYILTGGKHGKNIQSINVM